MKRVFDVILIGIFIYTVWRWIDDHRYLSVPIPSPLQTADDDRALSRSIMEAFRKSKYWRSTPGHMNDERSVSRQNLPLRINFEDGLNQVAFLSVGVSCSTGFAGSGCEDTIKLHVVPLHGMYSSDLTLYLTKHIRLTINEVNHKTSRDGTCEALGYIAKLKRVAMDGKIDAWLQEESSALILKSDQPSSKNEVVGFHVSNEHDGSLQGYAEGWINCGEPGIVILECLDPDSNDVLNELKKHRTKELPGWSSDPTRYYYFGSELYVDGDGEMREVRVDIRFIPSAGGNSRTVYSTNTMIRTWIR